MSTLNPAADAAISHATDAAPAKARARAKADDRAVAYYVENLSTLAKALRDQFEPFAKAATMPSHVQLLNWLARAAGHRNYQALRAAALTPGARPLLPPVGATPASAFDATLSTHAAKALTQFDERGRLTRWPNKFAVQRIALWALWQRFDARRSYSEREVNAVINTWATYGDHATLRRELINMKLLGRKSDCSEYWKEPQRAGDEVRAFLRALRERTLVGAGLPAMSGTRKTAST